MNIKPLYDRLLVERLEAETKTAGGIIIPDTASEKPQQGKVVAVGKGKISGKGDLIPLTVKPGDKILFAKWSGSEIEVDGVNHLVMKEDEVLAVIE